MVFHDCAVQAAQSSYESSLLNNCKQALCIADRSASASIDDPIATTADTHRRAHSGQWVEKVGNGESEQHQ
jgi:hypothetical protein